MKVLMDGRNHGAGTNTSKPCGVVVNGCVVKGNNSTCTGQLIICNGIKIFGHNPKANA
ncbi:MAG: hypothetical protein E6045_03705 [Finegoldia magna]|uniref:hypothetical protein n=1 Tax=Finegoldia magna TaxID=1260 RepID=UPI0029080A01|nr:hypothetical protein [Finegoldia magna]MDD6905280.1 hypothetical protein [Finegoldia magna]MDU5587704.1 hypothetical protein [Finegoldia magna]